MDVTAEDFRRHYQSLPDEALLEIDTAELVDVARTCHAKEVARRGLDAEAPVEQDATDAADAQPGTEAASSDELACIAEFDYVDEAEIAMGLLQAAEIPAALEHEPGVARLMVPGTLADQALRMLADSSLSDEELAAQAEAAGQLEEEIEGEAEEA